MSAGTRVYSLRLPDALVEEIRRDLESDDRHGTDPAATLTTWLIRAARERLAHRARGRACRRPRLERDKDGWPLVRVGLADPGSPSGASE
jgi:hypothetical protein